MHGGPYTSLYTPDFSCQDAAVDVTIQTAMLESAYNSKEFIVI